MIEFYDDNGLIGRVVFDADDDELQPDALTESIVAAWHASNRPVSEFETFYDGWSNGYVQARRVPDREVDEDDD